MSWTVPGAIGQFAIGQEVDGGGSGGSLMINSLPVTVTTTTMSFMASHAIMLNTMSVAITTQAVALTQHGSIRFDPLSIAVSMGAVTFTAITRKPIDTLALYTTLNDMHALHYRQMLIEPMALSVTTVPIMFQTNGHLQISPMVLNVVGSDTHFKRGWTMDTANVVLNLRALKLKATVAWHIDPMLPLVVRLNDTSSVLNNEPVTHIYTLDIATLPLYVTLVPFTLKAPTTTLDIGAISLAVTMCTMALNKGNVIDVTDGVTVSGQLSTLAAYTFNERIATSDLFKVVMTALLTQQMGISGALTAQSRYMLAVAEAMVIRDALLAASYVSINDQIVVADALNVLTSVSILDRLLLTSRCDTAAYFNLNIVERMKLVSSIGFFAGMDIADGVVITGTLDPIWKFNASLVDTLTVADVLSQSLIVRLDLAEGVEISLEQALQMTYTDELHEQIEISALQVQPGGTFTTWAINTRTNHVTEYRNWVFNSFAKMGGTYVGASDTGIYELVGDDDNGDPIGTAIRGGRFQPGGAQLTNLSHAYIGMAISDRAEGVFLKIITHDNTEYVYRVDPVDMSTARVTLGKGLRSRYYAFELITNGVDYDLDTIEFIPLAGKRRV